MRGWDGKMHRLYTATQKPAFNDRECLVFLKALTILLSVYFFSETKLREMTKALKNTSVQTDKLRPETAAAATFTGNQSLRHAICPFQTVKKSLASIKKLTLIS